MDDVISIDSSEDNSVESEINGDVSSDGNDNSSEHNTIIIDLTSVNDNLVIIQENQRFNSMLIGIFLFFVVGWFFMNNIFRRK